MCVLTFFIGTLISLFCSQGEVLLDVSKLKLVQSVLRHMAEAVGWALILASLSVLIYRVWQGSTDIVSAVSEVLKFGSGYWAGERVLDAVFEEFGAEFSTLSVTIVGFCGGLIAGVVVGALAGLILDGLASLISDAFQGGRCVPMNISDIYVNFSIALGIFGRHTLTTRLFFR